MKSCWLGFFNLNSDTTLKLLIRMADTSSRESHTNGAEKAKFKNKAVDLKKGEMHQ